MEDKLNILFQEHLFAYIDGLTRALSRMGANCSIFTDNPTKFQGADLKYFPLRNKTLSKIIPKTFIRITEKISLYNCLIHTINDFETDVFHLNRASDCEIFLKLKERYRIPIIYTNHYVTEPEPLDYLDSHECVTYEREKMLVPILSENSSKVITVSEFAKKRLKELFEIKSTTIYHGIDLNKFNLFVPKIKKEWLNVRDDEKIVLWVARFGHHPYKDPFTFIRAIPLVLRDHPKTKFVMIGKGFLKRYAINLAKKLSLNKSLIFFDYVENLNRFYGSSDVFVLTSFNDNFGLVVGEAMACGTPVIVSNRGAPKEVVGDAGLTFEYGCPRDLADIITMLLENEDLNKKLGTKARKRVVKNFTWDKAAEKYLQIYKKAIDH